MKKLICFLLAMAMLVACCLVSTTVQADGDILMLYDGEGDAGNGAQDPWGRLAGSDTEYYTEGYSSWGIQSFFEGVYFFQNTETYIGSAPNLEGYDYIEFDIMSYDDIICDLELSVVGNTTAHHGSDLELYEVFLPGETFVHVKMPLKDFVTRSPENRDKWDTETDTGKDEPHYAGYSLNKCSRLRWQLTFVKYMEKGLEVEDMPLADDLYVVFDNVHATKNGATHTHENPDMDVIDLQYWADVKEQFGGGSSSVVEPSQPVVSQPPESLPSESLPPESDATKTDASPVETPDYGDVNGQGGITAADALVVLQASVNKVTLTEEQAVKADVNGDKKIDATDALLILKFTVNKISIFPVAEKA